MHYNWVLIDQPKKQYLYYIEYTLCSSPHDKENEYLSDTNPDVHLSNINQRYPIDIKPLQYG
jgi:hypothetical protein